MVLFNRLIVPTERRRRILALALPIIGGMASQNILNLIDAAMVGQLGAKALAAVGLGGISNFVLSAMILGLGTGVQSTAARRLGQRRFGETALPLNGGLLLSLCMALPWSLLLVWRSSALFALLISDQGVIDLGAPYLRFRLFAMVAMGFNYSFRGYWNATNRPGLYMRTLVVMHVSNVLLNWVLIFGNLGVPALGVRGAGLASFIATWLGSIFYFGLGFRFARKDGFLSGLPSKKELSDLFRLSLPACVQQLFFAAGITVFMWLVGKVSTDAVAISHVLATLMLVGVLPSMGFGLASASLVGQALGGANRNDAEAWAWDVAKIGTGVISLIALPAVLFPTQVLSVFFANPYLIDQAVWPLRLIALSLTFDSVGMVFMHSLLGAGDTKTVMVVSMAFQWLVLLPVVYCVGPLLHWGLIAIWGAQGGYRVLQASVFVALWQKGKWQSIEV